MPDNQQAGRVYPPGLQPAAPGSAPHEGSLDELERERQSGRYPNGHLQAHRGELGRRHGLRHGI